MEEKDLKPPVPAAGIALGRNFLDVIGGLQAPYKNMGDPMTSEETLRETLKQTLEAQEQDPRT